MARQIQKGLLQTAIDNRYIALTLGGLGAQQTADRLLRLTDRHVGARRHRDDRTVVVLEKT